MDMSKDRVPLRFLLCLSILLTAVCLGVHLYLDTSWQGPPAPLALGRSIHSGQNWDQQTRMKPASAEAVEQDRNIQISFVQALKKDSHIRRKDGDREDLLSPLQPRRKQTPRWHIDLQPWASESHSLEDEAKRFLGYITTPQVTCASLAGVEAATETPAANWAACLDPKYSLIHRIHSKHCRVYSFGLEVDNKSLERLLSGSGCEVHCFDPSLEQPHLQRANMWFHRLSVHWRDPNPAVAGKHQYANTKKLATIFNDFGHRDVDVLKVDMESAEWKILENLVLEGVLASVGQLLLELHLHWAGFEVGGDDPAVVRYWFSLLKELEGANFHLFHVRSDPAKPRLFLHKNVLNASSAYKLSWVNTRWRPLRMTNKHRK